MNPGVYTYTVTGVAPCTNATATVTVTESSSPNAGTNGTLTVCGNGSAVSLFASLGGTPDAGGTWSGPSPVVGGNYDPTTMAPGVYTYTLNATAPCVSSSATVTVTENAATNAGTNGAITVCDVGSSVSLFAQLGGTPQAGGAWSGPSPVVGGNYDPATMNPGVYTYTVTGVAPCTNATATVTVTESSSPNAGTNGTLTVCGNGSAVGLFASLGGTPDAGGTWSGPSPVIGGNYDPGTMAPGVYTYTLNATAPCISSSATVTVTENAATNAGINGTLTVCDVGSSVSLFAQLGGTPQAGGAWSGPSPVVGGNYDPATMTPGVYTYTVTGVAPCSNATATVTVTESSSPNAGTNGALTVCGNGSAVGLFASLGGTPDAGGTWSGPSPVVGGSFDPSTMSAGVYTYSIIGTPPCSSVQATVTVVIELAPDAGLPATVTLCPGSPALDLYSELGGSPLSTGSWTDPANNSFDGVFDPGSDVPGTYTYTVTGDACSDASATVTVSVLPGPDAGDDNALVICSSQGPFNMLAQLGGTPDPGGTWTNASGNVVTSNFDPSNGTSGAFTYTVSGSSNCPDDIATLTIAVNIAPQAGNGGSITICESAAQISLFDGLTGTLDAGGSWTGPDGQPHASTLLPADDESGIYTYTVTGVAPCIDATAQVAVLINPIAYAGEDGNVVLCTTDAPVGLLQYLGGDAHQGGSWTDPEGVAMNGTFIPSTSMPGAYTYTVIGLAPCTNDAASVTVQTSIAADAGSGASVELCAGDPAFALFDQLGGTPDSNGVWTGPDGAVSSGFFDPASSEPGAYTYSVQATAPCPASTSLVVVDVVQPVVADFSVESVGSCAPVEVTLAHGYVGPGNCTWLLGNGTVVQDCAPVIATYDVPGSYDVTLIIDAGGNCGADTVFRADAVIAYARPSAGLTMEPSFINTLDPVAYFNNASAGANWYVWTIDGSFITAEEDLLHRFEAVLGETHEVCLIAYADTACADTVCRTVEVEDGLAVFVPNTFTPNGDVDNPTFKPVVLGLDPRFYTFEIYDRWGLRFFTTNDPSAAWDGTYAGQDAPVDVYVWKLVAKDAYSGERVEHIGHVTLLR
jgi:gliding motility-associated-like protein